MCTAAPPPSIVGSYRCKERPWALHTTTPSANRSRVQRRMFQQEPTKPILFTTQAKGNETRNARSRRVHFFPQVVERVAKPPSSTLSSPRHQQHSSLLPMLLCVDPLSFHEQPLLSCLSGFTFSRSNPTIETARSMSLFFLPPQ